MKGKNYENRLAQNVGAFSSDTKDEIKLTEEAIKEPEVINEIVEPVIEKETVVSDKVKEPVLKVKGIFASSNSYDEEDDNNDYVEEKKDVRGSYAISKTAHNNLKKYTKKYNYKSANDFLNDLLIKLNELL